MSKVLDETGFVFLDDVHKPYWCSMWGGEPWLFYWHPDKRWVSLRRVNQTEIWDFAQRSIKHEYADYYHQLNNRP